MKRNLLFLFALIMSAGFAFSQTSIPASSNVPGVEVLSAANGDAYTGANIFTGTDFSLWPWTSGPEAAFTPVKGGAYTMTFNFTATAAMNGMRVRWITSDSYGTNQSDPLVEGMFGEGSEGPGRFTVSAEDGTVADGLSAYFTTGGIASGSVLTYTVHFTMDDVLAFQNIGSIGIRGGSGSNDFVVNKLVITDDATGNMLVNYDKDASETPALPPSSSVPGVEVLSAANGDAYTGANIFTGTDFSLWPWTSGPEAAFTPVKGGAYTMTFNFTATAAMNGMRVRWITSDSYGTNQSDPLVEGMFGEGSEGPGRFTVSAEDGTVADGLSAYFTTGGIASGSVLTYTVHFTMDDVAAFQNIGSIGIRGGSGSNDFIINTIVITDDATGNMLVNYDKDGGSGNTSKNIAFDFESDAVGTTYPVMHNWGWPDANSSATVVADPLGVSTNSLEVTVGNYDGVVYFPVTLPEGSTVADITGVKFDAYSEGSSQNGTVELFMAPSDVTIGSGTAFNTYPVFVKTSDVDGSMLQVFNPGEWNTFSITKDQMSDNTFNMNGTTPDFSTLNGLSDFIFGIGVSLPGGSTYYMDNITVILDNGTSIVPVKSFISNAYGVTGGIKVNGINENVSIYSIDGSLVKQTIANQGTTIPVRQGLYIVKVGANKAVKVLVK